AARHAQNVALGLDKSVKIPGAYEFAVAGKRDRVRARQDVVSDGEERKVGKAHEQAAMDRAAAVQMMRLGLERAARAPVLADAEAEWAHQSLEWVGAVAPCGPAGERAFRDRQGL